MMSTVTIVWITTFLLVAASAVCSGLNIALMSLGLADLRRKAKLGNAAARRLLPLRRNSHLTLASILLTNVAAVSATSLVLEHEFNGIIAGLLSTLLIVILGEIMPQALFSRNPLQWCNRFYPVLRLMMLVTFVVSKPLQLLLDKLFGKELTTLQSRHELGILIAEHGNHKDSELDEDEVEIMQGALQLSEKHVRDIMTPIENVYWLSPESQIDALKIEEIKAVGRSRIPVFNQTMTTCYGVVLMKDLVDINFDETTLGYDDLQLYPTQVVGGMTALDTMFRKFIASRTHLIPVERDDKIVGIVTIEDLLEEIVGHEIEDESDRNHAPFREGRSLKT